MDKQIGRRGLLKIVAGAVAGAIGANALVQKVAAKEPTAIVTNHEGQIKAIKILPQEMVSNVDVPIAGPITLTYKPWVAPWPETTELAILPSHDHYLPPIQYDSRLTIISTPDSPNYLRDYRLDDGSDDVKLAYGWASVFAVAQDTGLTPAEVMETFSPQAVDTFVLMRQYDLKKVEAE